MEKRTVLPKAAIPAANAALFPLAQPSGFKELARKYIIGRCDILNAECYKPSGKISLPFLLIYPLMLLITIPIISYIYIHIVFFMPSAYFNILISILFGVILGCSVSISIRFGKVRNVLLTIVFSLIFVILAKYVMWCFYIPLVYSNVYNELQYSFLEGLEIALYLFISPGDVLEFIQEINFYGAWALESFEVTGILLYIVWFCEFCILAVACAIIAWNKVTEPFCEDDNKWFKENKKEIKVNMPESVQFFKEKLESGQSDELLTMLSVPFSADNHYLGVKFNYLEDVSYGYVTIQAVAKALGKDGKVKENRANLVKYLRVEGDIIKALQDYKA